MVKVKKYPIDSLYLGLVDDKRKVAFLDENGIYHSTYLVSSTADANFNNKFKVVSLFEEILKQNGLDVLITDSNGNLKQYLSIEEIKYLLEILRRKLTLPQITIQRSNIISNNVVNIVSDLLGLNISAPSTPFKFQEKFDINEILVSAKKIKLFKKYLLDYVQATLIADKSIRLVFEVGARDYRITRSLNKAKILQSNKLNQNVFSLSANLEGSIKVNDVDIKEIPKEQGFQKTIKY